MKRSRGFSLIEIAMVVAIGLLLLSLGLTAINSQVTSASYSTTKKRQDAIKDALIAYLGANRRLPCPDIPNSTNGTNDGSGITGIEDRQGGGSTPDTTKQCANTPAFGVVPYKTLGLSREAATDGWSNFFSYQGFQDTGGPSPCVTVKDWTLTRCFGAGKDGGIFVLDNTSNSPQLTTHAIAVVISHGANGLGAWAAQSTPNVAPTATSTSTCEERKNVNGDLSGCTTPAGVTGQYYYFKGERQDQDDMVMYIEATEAINALSKQGGIKSAIAQVNDDLQTLYDQTLGIKRGGITMSATPPVPDGCNRNVSIVSSIFDPWGSRYVVVDGGGNFPICIYSQGGGPETCTQATCVTTVTPATPPNPPAICKSIDQNSFNSYLAKAGFSGC